MNSSDSGSGDENHSGTFSYDMTSQQTAKISRHQRVVEKVKVLERELKQKLASNFNSVRKAFLELDEKHIGYITAEEIAKFLGASTQKRFDYTLLEILIKMRTTNLGTRVYYKDFCAWLGSTVEPTEGYYFRHDSMKNPQYELNMQKSRESQAPN